MDYAHSNNYRKLIAGIMQDGQARQLLNIWFGAIKTGLGADVKLEQLGEYLKQLPDGREFWSIAQGLADEFERGDVRLR